MLKKMKRILSVIILLISVLCMSAQNDVTTFLGIPIDGSKSSMRKHLIAKGFKPKKYNGNEVFEGQFNGTDVNIFIVTNNNKVYRLMVADKTFLNEANIKIRFNNLVKQFENNKRYFSLDTAYISENVDISYEMNVHNKNFDAQFYQWPVIEKMDTTSCSSAIQQELLKKYTEEQLKNPSEEIKQETLTVTTKYIMSLGLMKHVWFRICEYYGEYYISIYYDNQYNAANGNDL